MHEEISRSDSKKTRLQKVVAGEDFGKVNPDDSLARKSLATVMELQRSVVGHNAGESNGLERQVEVQPPDANKVRRSLAAKAAAKTKRENKALMSTAYGQLLFHLRAAERASSSAKSRPANGVHLRTFRNRGRYGRANYRRSRAARSKDYQEKSRSLEAACAIASEASIVYGWSHVSGRVPWVVYFDLPTGQVSFHSDKRGPGPDYNKNWDGQRDEVHRRIEEAIQQLLDKSI